MVVALTVEAASADRFRAGVRAGIPFAIPAFALAVSFGVLARTLGWGELAPIVFSLIVFSGSAQFAVASVLGAGGSTMAAILAAVLVNARFAAMGVALAPALRGRRLRRALEAQASVDASWALANRGDGRFDREILLGATLPQYVGWISGTVLGVVAGDVVGDPAAIGLDVVFPAFFLALLAEELSERGRALAAVLGGGIALALVPLTPPGARIIAACAVALLGWRR